ncbi:MAG TPA: hypothetical protein VKA09_07345 [Nitrososphaeraceae archaeon]|nr:hypothetical protein [Nitrososphaeraceae archaeon]
MKDVISKPELGKALIESRAEEIKKEKYNGEWLPVLPIDSYMGCSRSNEFAATNRCNHLYAPKSTTIKKVISS